MRSAGWKELVMCAAASTDQDFQQQSLSSIRYCSSTVRRNNANETAERAILLARQTDKTPARQTNNAEQLAH